VLGRRELGWLGVGPQLVAPAGHSTLVVGPTQVGKTSSLVLPAILRWRGPLVVASVKRDVLEDTRGWRGALGPVEVIAPGDPDACTWDPLEAVRTHRDALGVARDLAFGERSRASAESEFWNALAVKLLGALIFETKRCGGTIFDLVADVEDRRPLTSMPAGASEEVRRALASVQSHETRTADAVLTTVEAMLAPWSLHQALANLEGTLDDGGTVYLVAPRHQQRRHEGVLRGALSAVVAAQQERFDQGRARPLLLVLDEAASVAPLEDLDQLAATGSGLGITLMSVFQDFAQIEARWGERASTIVNNHATRVVLGGLVDHRVATYLPEALGDDKSATLRTRPRGSAVVVSGARPVRRTRLRPWWRSRSLRRRIAARAQRR
jgi:type IV secretory pathway TraG/TraD family ATPase VirD4